MQTIIYNPCKRPDIVDLLYITEIWWIKLLKFEISQIYTQKLMSILPIIEYFANYWVFCKLLSILPITEYFANYSNYWVFCQLLSVLSITEYFANYWVFCQLLSILSITEYFVNYWVFCQLLSILSITEYFANYFLKTMLKTSSLSELSGKIKAQRFATL